MVTSDDIGKRVQDDAGRVGILCDVIEGYRDPTVRPDGRPVQAVAFLRPVGGGCEWLVPPGAVCLA
ncbi:hypothetical protein [Streptomyces paromomycinus]|uniref:PRC-barrel domain containing protein n=1 Tax=Streptomyces paromomycinus TaxID=92743 RepID=A0A401VX54_STREY|nr:hypothetical protein [Streptomyces paromomycinus]GCD41670.1 hypothetical protein GKJPGBOP_01326 [Streptomyces paromomycinus]